MTNQASRKVVLTGYFNRGNLGDDAMLEGFSSYLSCRLKQDIALAPMPPSSEIAAMPAFLAKLRSADWAVLAGGTHFHDYYGFKSWRLLAQMAALFGVVRSSGTKVGFSGIGIGPLRSQIGRMLTRQLLTLSDSTTVRDASSLRVAEALRPGNAAAGFDLSLLSSPFPHASEAFARPGRLGISLVAYHAMYGLDSRRDDRMLDTLADVIAEQASRGTIAGVDIFPFSRAGTYTDVPISIAMARKLSGVLDVDVVGCESLAAVRERMSGLQAFIGARFHSILLAYQAGLPVVPIIYHEKCASLVDELGLNKDSALLPPDFLDATRAGQLLRGLLDDPDNHRGRLPLEEARQRAVQTVDHLVHAIEGEGDGKDQGSLSATLPGVRRAA
jgi:polysaccharide pyruvyl transferase WcaK-like protein